MKKHGIGSRLLSLLLVLAMVVPMVPISVSAAVGDLSNVSTGLTGDIDTSDTISLPIKIYDYEADGMLFEYAEANAGVSGTGEAKTAYDFGSEYCQVTDTTDDIGISSNVGGFDDKADVTVAAKSNDYVNYVRLTYKSATSNKWLKGNSGCYISTYNGKDDDGNWIGLLANLTDMDDVRYVTLVYRSNVTSDNMYFAFGDGAVQANTSGYYTNEYSFTNAGADGEGSSTNWTYVVYDLKTGTLASNWSGVTGPSYFYIGTPLDSSNEWIDIAHVAFFSDKDQATAFGEYALTDGSDRGDNRGFGLLRGSRTQNNSNGSASNGYGAAYTGIVTGTALNGVTTKNTVAQLNTYGDTTSIDFSTLKTLGYTLLGTFGQSGIANVGLLESSLSAEGYPVYKKEVVDYLAGLLKHSLEITERTSDGWKNYRYVKGTASSVYGDTDLATALRTKINKTTGSYAEASGKNLVGTWAEVGGNIASYYDAAYFLLNSIFVSGSYNVEQDDYDYLVLSAGTDSTTNDKVYVFDGGFATSSTPASASSAVKYDETNNTIQNTTAAGKAHFYYEGSNTTTLYPFLPVTDKNTASGMTISPYYQDDGVINGIKKQTTKDTLYQRNYNFAMVSEGEFVYHADDELFFEFEGDDDVYLFINGELVMDIGSAHSIDSVRFELNDYVNAAKAGTLGSPARNTALALEEGNTYSFKFYYMERHSYGSNIRICTNIKVTDPSMTTAKTAWQGTQLDFGSIVDPYEVVEYGFAITNNGEENLYNLTFTDNDIGVTLDPTNGLKVTGSRVYDVNGGTLEASDLTAIVSHPDYEDITVTFANNDALKAFLASLTSDAVVENGGGLWTNSTVLIRGIGYKLTDAQIAAGVFDNTVFTTSTNKTASKKLQGQASMRVFVPADPMYYEWAGHDLSITKAKLVTDVLAAAYQKDNSLSGKVPNLTTGNVNKIELVTKSGTAISSSNVTIDSSYNLTVNYDTTGSHVFYVKITYNSSKNTVIVPVLINVTDVKDSVYVLDYGLSVDLTADDELIKNDTLTVPGRSTSNSVLGIGTNGAYSPNEIIFTTQSSVEAKDDDGNVDGTFTYDSGTVKYTPSNFMEGLYTVQVAMNVYENDITPSKITGILDINSEVEMYKNITVLPATVVYYEDDFPAITYSCDDDSYTGTNTIVRVDSSSDLSQSNDQDEQYGHDDTYANAEEDEYSGNSLTKVTIKDPSTVASFTFKGTGFELIGRTNAYDSATLTVKVKDAGGNTVKTIPVITEFDNNADDGTEEIYQVPVIRVEDLPLASYTVEISGVPARDYNNVDANGTPAIIPTILYIDGLRIYQPLGESNDNYLATEAGADFIELRDEIVQGKIAVVDYSETEGIKVSTATSTWTENLSGDLECNQVSSVEDYLLKGPNNEVYMNGSYGNAALVFYVKETGTGVHNLQIALRAIDENLFTAGVEYGANVTIQYGVYDETNGYSWVNLVENNTSSAEQYYVIDYTKCHYDAEKGAYQVVIRVYDGMVSYSSLKLNGLELVSVNGDATNLYYVNGILSKYVETTDENGISTAEYVEADASTYVSFRSVSAQMASTTVLTDDAETEPDVTEPEETEPTEPETTEPEESVPETSEPEGTEPSEPEETKPGNDYEDSYENSRAEALKKLLSWLKGWMRP